MSLQQLVRARWVPQPYLVYKPLKAGGGMALKVQCRVDPVWEEREGPDGQVFLNPNVKGQGVFVELAKQQGKGENGYPTFGWGDPVRAKLGLADVTKLLTAMREVRGLGKEVPSAMRGKDGKPMVVSLFHKFGESGTAISYGFEAERSLLRVSKSREVAGSIAMDLSEEYGLQVYLQAALENFVWVGLR